MLVGKKKKKKKIDKNGWSVKKSRQKPWSVKNISHLAKI